MFVLSSTHNQLHDKYRQLKADHDALVNRWNDIIRRINAKGGEDFLLMQPGASFDKAEIKLLIKLCHPDKHHDNPDAMKITQKLLQLRKSQ